MMSKAVSENQGAVYVSQPLKGKQLHNTVKKVFNDKSHLPEMSRAFVSHSQIVCAILDCDDDNNYLSKRGGCGK